MSRPESLFDIDPQNVEWASIEVANIIGDPALLKAYATFMESVIKAGGEVDSSSSYRVRFLRAPSQSELQSQLRTAQNGWDEARKHYDQYASVGRCEYEYQERNAERHAQDEGLPWPPEVEPITSIDIVDRIDGVLA